VTDEFRHRTTIDVRFRDIDALGHVNNAVFFSYVEQARVRYFTEVLGLNVTERFPLILAHASIDFASPILLGERVEVATRVDWIGESSFAMSHQVRVGDDRRQAARSRTVIVAYDYGVARPMPVPDAWRGAMVAYEGRSLERPAPAAEAASVQRR
jgi:acyl-CoA thioester hydrolase